MVKRRQIQAVGALGGLLLAAWLLWPKPAPPAAPAPARRGGRTVGPDELPRIDLARLDGLDKLATIETGPRDPGGFEIPPAPPPTPAPPPPIEPVAVVTPASSPPPPPLNMTYLGTLESKAGLRVAVFLADKKTVLTGREGEVVGSRVRVVKIGLESVDVEDLTSGRSQRLALPKKGGSGSDAAPPREARGKEPEGSSE